MSAQILRFPVPAKLPAPEDCVTGEYLMERIAAARRENFPGMSPEKAARFDELIKQRCERRNERGTAA